MASRGIELGRGSVSIAVTVLDAAVRDGRQKEKELEAAKVRSEAAWAAGDVDAACQAGEVARAIQPDVAYARALCDGRDRIRALAGEADRSLAPPTAAGLQLAVDKLKAIEAINPKASVLAGLRGKLEAARAALKAEDPADADHKARLGQLLAGVQACQAQKWADCRAAIAKGLTGGETVFKPEDGRLVDKARALAAQAEAAEKKAADEATRKQAADTQNQAERKRRMQLLLAGTQACDASRWADCKEKLAAGLADGDRLFGPKDASTLARLRDLAAKADAEIKKASAANPTKPGTAKPVAPTCTPKLEGHNPDAATTWRFAQAGAIEFACDVPGHYEASMKGTLAVW
ncbi:MAG: hypothetical protein P4L82_07850 [Ancalomicrobiaceae bacterium]|nr:hypothetical protein [Ancalomicrobiaceae bacterium]